MNCQFGQCTQAHHGALGVSCTETGVGLIDPGGSPPSQHILLFYGSMILFYDSHATWRVSIITV